MNKDCVYALDAFPSLLLLLVKGPTETKVQLQDTSIKRTPEAPSMSIFPGMTDDTERYILVRRTGCEYDELGILVSRDTLNVVRRRFRLVAALSAMEKGSHKGSDLHEVWVEDIELVSLHDLWWWILRAVILAMLLARRKAILTRNAFDCTDSTRIQSAHD